MRNLFLALICFTLTIMSSVATAQEPAAENTKLETAVFAGGCFWCMEQPYDELDGVIPTTSGYTAGHVKNPSYQQVSSGSTGHTEAVKVVYDPEKISYEKLLDVFWVNIDPLTANAQFCDRGTQYRAGIFYNSEEQKRIALATLKKLSKKFNEPIVTEVTPLGEFYAAEDYHQNYYQTNPVRYKYYRWRCGRDARLKELWGEQAGK